MLKIRLNVKTPYDGKKRDNSKVSHYRDHIQAIHIEVEGAHQKKIVKYVKHLLSTAAIQYCYACDVCLVPLYDCNSSPHTQDKIRKYIVQHEQFCKCVVSNTCDGIEFLDQPNKPLKKTLRQLILGIPGSYFINIDLN